MNDTDDDTGNDLNQDLHGDATKRGVPGWYWVVGGIGLLWNIMGVMAYLMQVGMSAEDLVALEEAERRLFETTPSWVTGAFAIGVFGGALGCLSLLLRNSLAIPLLAISLVAVLVQMGYSVFLSDALDVYGSQALVMPGLVIIFAVLLLWFALFSRKTGWLR